MPIFQYQTRAETFGSIGADPAKWMPASHQPSRVVASIASLVVGVVAPILTIPATSPLSWLGLQTQPAIIRRFVPESLSVEPIRFAPIVAPTHWLPTYPQPRPRPYPFGSSLLRSTAEPTYVQPPPPTIVICNDQSIFAAIVALLGSTGEFVDVLYGTEDDIMFPSADESPYAGVIRVSANEVDTYDDGTYIRTVQFKVVIVSKDELYTARDAQLGTLESVVRNTLDGQCLAGCTFMAMTRMGIATYQDPKTPTQKLVINGQFVYQVIGYAARDITDTFDYIKG